MITSGSLTPGVDPDDFRLPVGTALRIEQAAAALRHLTPAYAMLDSDPEIWRGTTSWTLPGAARLWISLTDEPITVGVRGRRTVTIEHAMLLGPVGRGMPVTSRGGVSIMVEIAPSGWARWFDTPAVDWRDRVVPLAQIWPEARVNDLVARLRNLDRDEDLAPLLDRFLLDHLPPEHRDEALIERARALIVTGEVTGSGALTDALGINAHALRQLFSRHFGFTPKLAMRRVRFMRALAALVLADARPDFADPPPGYHDVPHFLRDAADFLDLTPRRFLALPVPYVRALLRARHIVVGSASSLLDHPGGRTLS